MSNFIICTFIERPYKNLTKVRFKLVESIIWPILGLERKGVESNLTMLWVLILLLN
jgi:hypothetical protein